MKKIEIWARFENGVEIKVETHKNIKNAQSAIDSMNHHNQHDLSVEYSFPYGLPSYSIRY